MIKSLSIKNPYLEKESGEDKLSILDIRAELDDDTSILIEMHMYGLGELKAKTIRSWSRAFGEELEAGSSYMEQPPTIIIAFTNGAVEPIEKIESSEAGTNSKIHRLCMIMDREDFTVFTDAMELHYIDMKAFAKAVNEAGSIHIDDTEETKFAKWLSVITQKEIKNKTIIEDACKEEEIFMAVSTLARQSEDKYTRHAYQRRKDDIYYNNMYIARAEQERQRAEQERQRAEQAETEIEELRAQLARLQAQIDLK